MQLPLSQIIPAEPVQLFNHTIATCTTTARPIVTSVSASSDPRVDAAIHALNPLQPLRAPLFTPPTRAGTADDGEAKRRAADGVASLPPPLRSIVPYDAPSSLFFLLPRRARGSAPSTAENRVLLWDALQHRVVLELELREKILALQCRTDMLVVVHRRRVVLYRLRMGGEGGSGEPEALELASFRQREKTEFETCDNILGLAALATSPGSTLLAIPGRQPGQVQLVRLPPAPSPSPSHSQHSRPQHPPPPGGSYPIVHIFICHTSPLRTLTLSRTGALLATSSTKGTLLRIYSTSTSTEAGPVPRSPLLRELRRGSDQADIWSVSFADPDAGRKIACSSDKGTIHVWDVGDLSGPDTATRGSAQQQGKADTASASASASANTSASPGAGASAPDKRLSMLKPYLPAYFSSQWSDMHWRIPVSSVLHGDGRENAVDGDDVATCVFVPREATLTSQEKEHQRGPAGTGETEGNELVVITRSGAYFRLSTSTTARPAGTADADPSPGTGSGTGSGKQATGSAGRASRSTIPQQHEADGKKCRMLEYRKLQLAGDGATDEDGFERWE